MEPIEWPEAGLRERGGPVGGRAAGRSGRWGRFVARSCARPRAAGRPGEWVLLASVAIFTCGFVIMVGLFGMGDAPEVGETTVVQVRAGETLWGIANRMASGSDPHAVVQRIVESNGLGAPSVETGQSLVVPTNG
ncbi:hypothetical protein GCM10009854_16090 [Saccharopolyspora halophila]|uniref:LysM domain-containing protein n=1 Tax=Saccharopolyspora halophila TaxID=405551 RepID=A0ABN3FZH2_9PSEU